MSIAVDQTCWIQQPLQAHPDSRTWGSTLNAQRRCPILWASETSQNQHRTLRSRCRHPVLSTNGAHELSGRRSSPWHSSLMRVNRAKSERMKIEAGIVILISTAVKCYVYAKATYQRNRTAANIHEHVCINDRSLAKKVEAVTCCCSWGHFAIGNGVET